MSTRYYTTQSSRFTTRANGFFAARDNTPSRVRSAIISEQKVRRGVNNVQHYKTLNFPSGNLGRITETDSIYVSNYCHDVEVTREWARPHLEPMFVANVNSCLKDFDNRVSDFELLPTLVDLDDTIGMFSSKFLKELSYGSVTWGILPFVSDCQNLLSAIKAIVARAQGSSCTRVSRRRPLIYSRPYSSIQEGSHEVGVCTSIVGSTFLHGVVVEQNPSLHTISDNLDKAGFLLDKLGVHPDLKTLWDVLPLSFVVDYFIPIGDLLESCHPRGWQQPTSHFTGFISHKGSYQVASYRNVSGYRFNEIPSVISFYDRKYVESLPVVKQVPVTFKSPSLKEIFNTAYLTSSLKSLF